MHYHIKENSWICSLGRKYMKCNALAMVIGNTIHLSGVSKDDFLKDTKWLKHELVHVQQYKKMGKLKFISIYLLETLKKGYYNNKLEVEAREQLAEIELDRFRLKS